MSYWSYCKKCGVLYSGDICPKCGIIEAPAEEKDAEEVSTDEKRPLIANKRDWLIMLGAIPAFIGIIYCIIRILQKLLNGG